MQSASVSPPSASPPPPADSTARSESGEAKEADYKEQMNNALEIAR